MPERKKDNCLNCEAKIYGKYCHVCGQENVEPSETTWHLISHFFNDITHFDGKFFTSLKLLIFKPGFLTTEYKMGRRASYLNPVRMYIFTSALFFFLFFSFYKIPESKNFINLDANLPDTSVINKMNDSAYQAFVKKITGMDSTISRQKYSRYKDSIDKEGFHITGRQYTSRQQYDSFLKAGKKHNWLERQLTYKQIEINKKYGNDKQKIGAAFFSNLLHSFPQMLFVSLPLFAVFLKLLYIRRKNFLYVSHAIFTIHFYIFIFIVLLIAMAVKQLLATAGIAPGMLGGFLMYGLIFFYEYKAMRNFYEQRRAKTIVKFLLLNFWLLFIVTFLFVIFLFTSFLKV